MLGKNYYCLIGGLQDYFLDSDVKGFDRTALDVIGEIKESISKRDRKCVELLYAYYDIENIINLRSGRAQFSDLGNFSREELEEELETPSRLPEYLSKVIAAYAGDEEDEEPDEDEREIDINTSFERNLFEAYYKVCAKSGSKFLRNWAEFDRTLRNISAAFVARDRKLPVAEYLVGQGDVVAALSKSSAADFGLRGDIDYIDQLMAAISDNSNLIEKERRIDVIRWQIAEELSAHDYFDINYLLAYLVRINIIYRWAALDPVRGKELLHELIKSLSNKEVIDNVMLSAK